MKDLHFNELSVMVSMICNDYHDLLMISIDINSIAILNIHDVDYCCIINGITKSLAMNLLKILV